MQRAGAVASGKAAGAAILVVVDVTRRPESGAVGAVSLLLARHLVVHYVKMRRILLNCIWLAIQHSRIIWLLVHVRPRIAIPPRSIRILRTIIMHSRHIKLHLLILISSAKSLVLRSRIWIIKLWTMLHRRIWRYHLRLPPHHPALDLLLLSLLLMFQLCLFIIQGRRLLKVIRHLDMPLNVLLVYEHLLVLDLVLLMLYRLDLMWVALPDHLNVVVMAMA